MVGTTVKAYPDQDPLALQVDIGDGELAGQRHVCGVKGVSIELSRNLLVPKVNRRGVSVGERSAGRCVWLEYGRCLGGRRTAGMVGF